MTTFKCNFRFPLDKWEAKELKPEDKTQLGVLEQDYDYAHNGRIFTIAVGADNKEEAITTAKMKMIDLINSNIKGLEELRTIILTSKV